MDVVKITLDRARLLVYPLFLGSLLWFGRAMKIYLDSY